MGTNFYWTNEIVPDFSQSENPRSHIGKRSAHGWYCWTCGTTLSSGGTILHEDNKQLEKCPICGSAPIKDGSIPDATAIELGFVKTKDLKRETLQGVRSCSMFVWSMMSHKWKLQSMLFDERKVVIDEYGNLYSAREFLEEELAHVAVEQQLPSEFC